MQHSFTSLNNAAIDEHGTCVMYKEAALAINIYLFEIRTCYDYHKLIWICERVYSLSIHSIRNRATACRICSGPYWFCVVFKLPSIPPILNDEN